MPYISFVYMFAGAWLTLQVAMSQPPLLEVKEGEEAAGITVLFFGDSLTAAYGLAPEQGFAGLVRDRLRAAAPRTRVIIAGVSGETTAGGVRRIDWLLKRRIDVMVLALGGNDGLRGIDPGSMRENLEGIIARARRAHPRIRLVIAGMEAPPNMGAQYTRRFRKVFEEVAAANGAALIPFLLEGVASVPDLNLPDGIHPNPEGHRVVARNVWAVLGPLLESMHRERGGAFAACPWTGGSEKGDESQVLENCKDQE